MATNTQWDEMSPWIGVDLDGTLAHYDGWQGPFHIGEPIDAMVSKVLNTIAKGTKVKIFTARVCGKYSAMAPAWKQAESVENHIKEWCKKHLGLELEVTCLKDWYMIELWDDRAKQVIPNTGQFVGASNAH